MTIDAESRSVIQWSNAIQKTALGQFVGRARLVTIRLERTLWAGGVIDEPARDEGCRAETAAAANTRKRAAHKSVNPGS